MNPMEIAKSLTPEEKQHYGGLYRAANASGSADGLTIPDTVKFLSQSGLAQQDLKAVWDIGIASQGPKEKVSQIDFLVCLRLIAAAQAKLPITAESIQPGATLPLPVFQGIQPVAPPLPPTGSAPPTPNAASASTPNAAQMAQPSPTLSAGPGTPRIERNPSGTIPTTGSVYAMPQEARSGFEKVFAQQLQMAGSIDGKLQGANAVPFFNQSGLPTDMLRKIWGLSDMDQDGTLTLDEFCVAMYLILLAKRNIPVPDQLPDELKPHSAPQASAAANALDSHAVPPGRAMSNSLGAQSLSSSGNNEPDPFMEIQQPPAPPPPQPAVVPPVQVMQPPQSHPAMIARTSSSMSAGSTRSMLSQPPQQQPMPGSPVTESQQLRYPPVQQQQQQSMAPPANYDPASLGQDSANSNQTLAGVEASLKQASLFTKSEITRVTGELAALRSERETLVKSIQELNKVFKEDQEQLAKLDAELKTLKAEVQTLRQQHDQQKDQALAQKTQMIGAMDEKIKFEQQKASQAAYAPSISPKYAESPTGSSSQPPQAPPKRPAPMPSTSDAPPPVRRAPMPPPVSSLESSAGQGGDEPFDAFPGGSNSAGLPTPPHIAGAVNANGFSATPPATVAQSNTAVPSMTEDPFASFGGSGFDFTSTSGTANSNNNASDPFNLQ